jgi:predicted PurR-regulated permease PerM
LEINTRIVRTRSRIFPCISAVSLVLLFWLAWRVLLFAFAGIIIGVLLCGVTDLIARRTNLTRGLAYALAVSSIVVIMGGVLWFIAPHVVAQTKQLIQDFPRSLRHLNRLLGSYETGRDLVELLPATSNSDSIGLLTHVFSSTAEAFGELVGVLIVGLYLGLEPNLYLRGVTALIPLDKRQRILPVLREMANTLRWWMLGQFLSMAVVGTATMIGLWLMGIPLPLALGLLTALLMFIPYFGSLLSAVPALLIALQDGAAMTTWVAVLYMGVHVAEGYFLTPIVQRRATIVPPALTVLVQFLMWCLAGTLGIALATPLTAVGLVLVRWIYLKELPGNEVSTRRTRPVQQNVQLA